MNTGKIFLEPPALCCDESTPNRNLTHVVEYSCGFIYNSNADKQRTGVGGGAGQTHRCFPQLIIKLSRGFGVR